jgi:hypothetical protein
VDGELRICPNETGIRGLAFVMTISRLTSASPVAAFWFPSVSPKSGLALAPRTSPTPLTHDCAATLPPCKTI